MNSVKGNKVMVRARLCTGKPSVGEEFSVTDKKDDLPGLAQALVEKAHEMLK